MKYPYLDISPRQSGKTTRMLAIAKHITRTLIIISPNESISEHHRKVMEETSEAEEGISIEYVWTKDQLDDILNEVDIAHDSHPDEVADFFCLMYDGLGQLEVPIIPHSDFFYCSTESSNEDVRVLVEQFDINIAACDPPEETTNMFVDGFDEND